MKTNKTKNTTQKHKRLPVQMPEKTKHRMKINKTKNTTQKPKRLPIQMPVKNKTQNEDKQNKEHNTESLRDYQYR
jgi:hypothetical protein